MKHVCALFALTLVALVGCSGSSTSGNNGSSGSSGSSGSAPSGEGVGCGAKNAADYNPAIDPAKFSTKIDNKYLSFIPGTVLNFVQTNGNMVEQDVLTEQKVVMGVATVVVHDFLMDTGGKTLEDTYDYYAQDADGNVWYFGEDTKAYSGSTVSAQGSWVAGENCAKPGIVMKAQPKVGDSYRQEYLAGGAEDMAEVVSVDEAVTVAYGAFQHCLMTKETTALAPGDVENKYYCPGVGLIRSKDTGSIDTGKTEDLVSANGKTSP